MFFECITSTMMAIAMKGLKLKPKYEDLINVAVSDKLYDINFLIVMPSFYEMVLF